MKKRAEKLYDSITDLDQRYLLEAEEFETKADKPVIVRWKAWAGLAAAIVLAVGVGIGMPGWDNKSESAPDSEPTAGNSYFSTQNGSLEHLQDCSDSLLRGGELLRLDSGETYVVTEELSEEEAKTKLDGKNKVHLELVDGVYVRREQPTGTAFYVLQSEEAVFWDGQCYYRAQKQD